MSAKEAVTRIKEILGHIEKGLPDDAVGGGLRTLTITVELGEQRGKALERGEAVEITSQDSSWSAIRDDWYVVLRCTTAKLTGQITDMLRGQGIEHDARNKTTVWVFSKKYPKGTKSISR